MSTTYFDRDAAGHGTWQAASDTFGGAMRQMQRWLKRRRDRRHLNQLPDYLLRDIGISRVEIDYFTRSDHRAALRRRV